MAGKKAGKKAGRATIRPPRTGRRGRRKKRPRVGSFYSQEFLRLDSPTRAVKLGRFTDLVKKKRSAAEQKEFEELYQFMFGELPKKKK